jgi:p-aminobenzoyl-glutamate transporter AbgT
MMASYARAKKRFVNFQKMNMIGSFFFMLLTIPVTGKLINDENLFESLDTKLLIALPICFLLFFLMIRYISKFSCGLLKQSEDILSEIAEK